MRTTSSNPPVAATAPLVSPLPTALDRLQTKIQHPTVIKSTNFDRVLSLEIAPATRNSEALENVRKSVSGTVREVKEIGLGAVLDLLEFADTWGVNVPLTHWNGATSKTVRKQKESTEYLLLQLREKYGVNDEGKNDQEQNLNKLFKYGYGYVYPRPLQALQDYAEQKTSIDKMFDERFTVFVVDATNASELKDVFEVLGSQRNKSVYVDTENLYHCSTLPQGRKKTLTALIQIAEFIDPDEKNIDADPENARGRVFLIRTQ